MKPIKLRYSQLAALLIAYLTLSTGTITPLQMPKKAQKCTSYVKQRALFTKVFIRALWNHALKKNNHTIIEEKLLKTYAAFIKKDAYEQAHALQDAINKSESISISPNEWCLGASSSAYQIDGNLDETSAAARFYQKIELPTAGDAIDFNNLYESDLQQLAEELHINSFRLSVPWNSIEPQEGVFNKKAIKDFGKKLRCCLRHNIKPMVAFHHYDVPQWFEDRGGFEHKKNGKLFQRFCLEVYTELANELGESLLSMCNAPEGPAFKGYFTGDGTPGEKDNLHKTHKVIANMYYELVDTALAIQKKYEKLKKDNPELKKPYIGTQLNILPFDPHPASQNSLLNRIKTTIGCEMASYIQTGGTYKFLVNGEYRMFTPDKDFMKEARAVDVYRSHPDAYKAFDWIGVNVYSNNFLNGTSRINGKDLIEEDEERCTDNANYRNYPEGIYRAVQMIAENVTIPLGKKRNKNGQSLPIIITENGIATKDDAKRTRYFQRALCTITELIKDGYNVTGYLPWTSHDNYEWPTQENPEGFGSKCYGFFAVNFDKNSPDYLKRTLKPGSQYYANFAQEFFKKA